MKFLSAEWLSTANELTKTTPPLDADLTVGFRILNCPGQPEVVEYCVSLGSDWVRFSSGCTDANVTFSLDWDLARSIGQAESGALRAFLDGRLTLDGDPSALLGHHGRLSKLGDHLAGLRAITEFR